MAAKKVDINIKTTADTTGLQQTTTGVKQLTAATNASNTSSKAMSANTSKVGQIAGQAGFQIQDFAVQVGAGTSALTAFGQQAPQLLGIFGPAGAIAGAVVAIGAVAAKVFLEMGDDAEEASKRAEVLATAFDKIRGNAEKIQSEELDMGREALDDAIRLTEILRIGYNEVAASERKYSDQALKSVELLRQAEVQLRRLRGEDVDERKEAAKDEDARLQKIEQRKQAELTAQDLRLQGAEQERIAAEEIVEKRALLLANKRAELAVLLEQNEAVRKQKAELENLSKMTLPGKDPITNIPRRIPFPGAEAAAETLKNTPFDAQIQSLEGKIDSLWKDTADGTGKLYKDLSEGIRALNEVNAALPALAQSIAVEADNIVLAADTEVIQATVAARTQEAKANAEATNELLKDFVPVTTQQAEALAVIKQKTEDLKIEADEAPLVATNLQLIRNSLRAGQDLSIKNTDDIIISLNTFLLRLNEQSKQIDALQQRVQRIPVR